MINYNQIGLDFTKYNWTGLGLMNYNWTGLGLTNHTQVLNFTLPGRIITTGPSHDTLWNLGKSIPQSSLIYDY